MLRLYALIHTLRGRYGFIDSKYVAQGSTFIQTRYLYSTDESRSATVARVLIHESVVLSIVQGLQCYGAWGMGDILRHASIARDFCGHE